MPKLTHRIRMSYHGVLIAKFGVYEGEVPEDKLEKTKWIYSHTECTFRLESIKPTGSTSTGEWHADF